MSSFFKHAFYLIFFLLFLLSLFLIEGEYRFYLFGLWSVFVLVFSLVFLKQPAKEQRLENQKTSKTIVFSLVMSLLFMADLIFSRQIPITIEKTLFYLVSLSIFVFFSSLKNGKFEAKLFFHYLSIVTIMVNALVLFFTFYNGQQSLFPGMNLLVRNYGHNHYAAFLLLVIPIFWWQFLFASKEDRGSRIFSTILLISSYLLIILSLARLALLISLLQLVLIFFTNKKIFSSFKNGELIRVLVKTFIFAFLSIGVVFLFLSTSFNKDGQSSCPLVFNKKEICRPLLENYRFIYWEKAWLVFKENPIFGAGLKNFNFASRQFPIEDQQITSYAHNIFLHNLSEGGILAGGFFIFFIIYIFYRSFKITKNSNEALYKFLWLAAAASLANAMLDFDWNFFIIFMLTMVYLAIILRDEDCQAVIKLSYLKKYFVFMAILSSFFAFYNFAAGIAYKINKPALIIKYLPYSDKEVRSLLNEGKLSNDDFSALYHIYKNDPVFIFKFVAQEQMDPEKRADLLIRYADLDPASFINIIKFESYDAQVAEPLANKFVEVLTKNNFLNNGNFLDYWDQRNIAQQFFNFANQAYMANNAELAANYYKKAMLLNDLVMMGGIRPSFLDSSDFSQVAILLKGLGDFDPNSMNQYFYDYMAVYERTLIYLFQNNHLDDFYLLAEAMFQKQPNFSWFLWRDLIAESNNKPEEEQRLLSIYEHFKDLPTWYDFLPTVIQFKLKEVNS